MNSICRKVFVIFGVLVICSNSIYAANINEIRAVLLKEAQRKTIDINSKKQTLLDIEKSLTDFEMVKTLREGGTTSLSLGLMGLGLLGSFLVTRGYMHSLGSSSLIALPSIIVPSAATFGTGFFMYINNDADRLEILSEIQLTKKKLKNDLEVINQLDSAITLLGQMNLESLLSRLILQREASLLKTQTQLAQVESQLDYAVFIDDEVRVNVQYGTAGYFLLGALFVKDGSAISKAGVNASTWIIRGKKAAATGRGFINRGLMLMLGAIALTGTSDGFITMSNREYLRLGKDLELVKSFVAADLAELTHLEALVN